MRWDALFDDLEAQARAIAQSERAAEVADRSRFEIGAVGVTDRARAAVGRRLRIRLAGGWALAGHLVRCGPDWLLLDDETAHEALVASDHVMSVSGFGRHSATPGTEGAVESRIRMRHVLRGMVRDRSGVQVRLVDSTSVDGTIDRVGADFVEVATHDAGEPRRRHVVRDVQLVPLRAIAAVRRSV